MAQLPPKVPNMTQNWPNFHHQKMPSLGNLMPTAAANGSTQQQQQQHSPSWVDEFLDFSSTKRNAHRRSASDSITFLEAPFVEECRANSAGLRPGNNEFDRLDDEQLMSMFSDDISTTIPQNLSSSNPSTPSDHNSINDDKPTPSDQQQQLKNESGEVQSSCQSDQVPTPNSNGDSIIDPKRVKRILANRQSAQRSRVRKLQYISELERSVTSLQTEVSALSPRVAFLDHQRLVLNVDNSALKQRIAALAQDKIFKDAHQEALKKEIERLRQVYHQQNLKKMNNNNNSSTDNQNQNGTDQEEQQPIN
ncbi:basic leucine zipper 61-like [Papaver somniferum]|uniref:basic leucine zipper 61-like n=1 Tax=Papaver somniferum TaxID=3469 RepID=UPI000E6F9B6B|nr:basic leucine zipper 61-like [Papaver somniferum]XP_026412449.1 basic leucine zipper 61-like [Papaver somniferum]